MSADLIRYDLLVQDALRGVVRRVLTDVARDGLPGEHHLFISFGTRAPGVKIAPRLAERHPEEMTIVLQHQFWNLIVTETFFEVGLSFNGVPERLHVPYAALKGFFDPSVKFGLQFEPAETAEELEEPAAQVPLSRAPEPVEALPRPAAPKPASVPAAGTPAARAEPAKPAPAAAAKPAAAKEAPAKEAPAKDPATKDRPSAKPVTGKPKDGGAEVVRLDSFRKK
ncbi:MAG TPA: ClpXP protease specificity-enhancing factor SspB [Xanthobacteraceae bacterium]|nr:ClpXP protease specificity-enhancing factor SspB [Xanthobacteraceae bacterium]